MLEPSPGVPESGLLLGLGSSWQPCPGAPVAAWGQASVGIILLLLLTGLGTGHLNFVSHPASRSYSFRR